jgi:hypothetical protein
MFAEHNLYSAMEFVDRIEETARLRRALSSEEPTLSVLYGRRRLGKSTLMKRVLTDGDVYYLADRSEGGHQRALAAQVIAQTFPDFDRVTYPDWEALLRTLNLHATHRFTLCLDEFPFLVEQSPELPSVLQKLIDEKRLGYNMVLCGSSQSMMYGLFLDATAPLYGRATTLMKLRPIRPTFLGQALHLGPSEAIEEYAVWGGVPRYWELREADATLVDALWQHLLSANGTLYEEPFKLFQDDIKDIVKTATLMSYIGSGANRISEIAARCGEPATNLSRPLRKLIDLGYLEKEVPFGAEEKNTKKSLYKIADPLMAFYFQFVVPNRTFIELERKAPIQRALDLHFTEFVSRQWEELCRDAVTGNEVEGVLYGRASRWWGSVLNEEQRPEEMELDLVAESLDKSTLLVGECKWTHQEDAVRLAAELERKAQLLPFAKGHKVVTKLFLKTPPKVEVGNVFYPADVLRLLE